MNRDPWNIQVNRNQLPFIHQYGSLSDLRRSEDATVFLHSRHRPGITHQTFPGGLGPVYPLNVTWAPVYYSPPISQFNTAQVTDRHFALRPPREMATDHVPGAPEHGRFVVPLPPEPFHSEPCAIRDYTTAVNPVNRRNRNQDTVQAWTATPAGPAHPTNRDRDNAVRTGTDTVQSDLATPILEWPLPFPDGFDAPSTAADLLRDAISQLDEHVFNEMPAHLIYIPTRKIIDRSDVKALVLTRIEELLDKFMHQSQFDSDYERERAISSSVRHVARYAIFSHRWRAEGEPSFQDVRGEKLGGPGYDKLVKFCEKAHSYGCLFAWSDTCCINKESSTELEEAIRSMFRWYHNAYICIAYLADSSSPQDFKKDDWFTRGWTLQELLAPKMIKFFGTEWEPLGRYRQAYDDRRDDEFTTVLSEVTKIPVIDLQHFRPGSDRVHEKMMWASMRKTTRIEDVAYSLIGIFDVSLTVAYGEGKRAWTRLMEAVVQSCDEWQVFAAAGHFWGVIPDSPQRYCALTTRSDPILNPGNRHTRVHSGDRFFEITKRGVQLKVIAVPVAWKEQGCSHLCSHSQRLPPESPCPAHVVYTPVAQPYLERAFLPVRMRGNHLPWAISDIHRYRDFNEWALGILHYKETGRSDEGELEGQKDYIFLLLGRVGQRSSLDPRPHTYHDQVWCKVPTARVFTARCVKTVRIPLTTVWL
ncbi:hypothetical protein HYDPIDRAFT_119184 [Hydnomerulius pinastri MD-312]|uniref:Heterokaryon incompatibility domain-containing protein n=1 Tax=Hydnomerulius pinastri MD-312 TaxID=994086 RepID=A0A0C9V0Q4_9AGAM|nr:hypothetical protein HYDPIDRAFT_119184 [Hydnomerulius pinastri MD-312]